ncbi:MAG: hypothetical protein PHN35_06990 [Clostridia bacterium]|nr:hypothetical protein [Clostridia bacterium]MDD4798979.1 hypothetical protein [Clostridia bacterium]
MNLFGSKKQKQPQQSIENNHVSEKLYERRIKITACDQINPDGSNRQDILWQIAEKVRPYDDTFNISIEEFNADGQKGYYIKTGDKIIGQAEAKAAVWLAQYSQRITGISDFKVTGGEKRVINDHTKEIHNEFTPYTATIIITVKQKD